MKTTYSILVLKDNWKLPAAAIPPRGSNSHIKTKKEAKKIGKSLVDFKMISDYRIVTTGDVWKYLKGMMTFDQLLRSGKKR